MRPAKVLCLLLALGFLAFGCKKNPAAASRQSPAVRAVLLHAAAVGDLERIRSVVSRGVDVNVKGDYDDNTPLHHAAKNGHAEIAKLLIDHGADINAKAVYRMGLLGEGDFTPLHFAADQGYKNVVKLLVEKGANVEAKAVPSGATPLSWACNKDVAEVLLGNDSRASLEPSESWPTICTSVRYGQQGCYN